MSKLNLDSVQQHLGVSRRFQPTIYKVVREESESEVQNIQILQENLKMSISNFHRNVVQPDQVVMCLI